MDPDPNRRRGRSGRDMPSQRREQTEREDQSPSPRSNDSRDREGQNGPRPASSRLRHVDPSVTDREFLHLVHERMRRAGFGPAPPSAPAPAPAPRSLQPSVDPSLPSMEPPSTAPSTVHSPSSHSRMSHSVYDHSVVNSPMSSADGTSLHFRSHSHSQSHSQSTSQSQSRRSSQLSHGQFHLVSSSHRHSRNSSISSPHSGAVAASNQSFSADSTPYAHHYAVLASQLAQHGKHIARYPPNQPPRALTDVDLQPVRRLSISSRGRAILTPLAPRHANLPFGSSSAALAPSSALGIPAAVGRGLRSPLEQKHSHNRERHRHRERDPDLQTASVFSPPQLVTDSLPIDCVDIRPVALPPSRARAAHRPAAQPPLAVGPGGDEDSDTELGPLDMQQLHRALKSPASAFDPLSMSPANLHNSDPRLWSPLSSSSSAATSCLSPPPQMQTHAMAQDALNGGMSPNQWGRLLTSYRQTSNRDQVANGSGGEAQGLDEDPDMPPDPTRR